MTILPWLEVNPLTQPLIEVRDGLAHWKKVSDNYLLSTEPRWVNRVYGSVELEHVPGIVPGIKVSPLRRYGQGMLPLHHPEIWRRLSLAVERAGELTEQYDVFLELESFRKHWFDPASLTKPVRDWMPIHRTYTLYPTLWGTDSERRLQWEFTSALARGLNDVELTALQINRPNDVHCGVARECDAQLQAFEWEHGIIGPRYQVIYLWAADGTEKAGKYWHFGPNSDPARHFSQALEHLRKNDIALIYPHVRHWSESDIIVSEIQEYLSHE